MKVELKAKDTSPSTYTLTLTGTMTGSLHQEYVQTREYKFGPNDEFEEYDVIDEFLPTKIKKFIPRLVKDFEAKTGISVSGWDEDSMETEGYPQNEEQTKNVNMKFTLEITCDVPYVIYTHSSELI